MKRHIGLAGERILAVAAVVIMLLALVSCGGSDNGEASGLSQQIEALQRAIEAVSAELQSSVVELSSSVADLKDSISDVADETALTAQVLSLSLIHI